MDHEVVIHWLINTKKKLMFISGEKEDQIVIEIKNGMIFGQVTDRWKRILTRNRNTQIAYDRTAKITGWGSVRKDDNTFEYTIDLVGSCEESDDCSSAWKCKDLRLIAVHLFSDVRSRRSLRRSARDVTI